MATTFDIASALAEREQEVKDLKALNALNSTLDQLKSDYEAKCNKAINEAFGSDDKYRSVLARFEAPRQNVVKPGKQGKGKRTKVTPEMVTQWKKAVKGGKSVLALSKEPGAPSYLTLLKYVNGTASKKAKK